MTPSSKATVGSRYAEVAPAVPLPVTGPQTFTYQVPATTSEDALLYTKVQVPFGRRRINGIVMGTAASTRLRFKVKPLIPGASFQLTTHQVRFARWLSDTMHGSLGFTLRLFFPPTKTVPVTAPPDLSSLAALRARRTPFLKADSQSLLILEQHDDKRARLIATQAAAVVKTAQVLIIVPERHLLAGHIAALRRYLPADLSAAYHSALTGSERTAIWQGVQTGRVRVIVGTQPALWLPYQHLGLLVLDYESYAAHKSWDAYPRLHNRDGSTKLAQIHEAPLIFADRAPSLHMYWQAQHQPSFLVHNQPLEPRLTTISTSFEDRRARHLLPDEFIHRLKQWLRHHERVFLLHNRRGSWSYAVCRQCQAVVRCPECDIALSVHGHHPAATLQCHHCGHTQAAPSTCPACHRGRLSFSRPAADTVAAVLKKHVPRTSVTVIDRDSRAAGQRLPHRTKKGDLIIGTNAALQLLPELTPDRLVFLFPEQSLLYPDFRSRERTLHLITRLQAAAPARRRVVLVTRYPHLAAELEQSRETAYALDLKQRQRLKYPPFTDLVRLTFQSKTLDTARARAATIRTAMEKQAPNSVRIRGPFESFVRRSHGKYESHVLLSGSLDELTPLYASHDIDVVDLSPTRIL